MLFLHFQFTFNLRYFTFLAPSITISVNATVRKHPHCVVYQKSEVIFEQSMASKRVMIQSDFGLMHWVNMTLVTGDCQKPILFSLQQLMFRSHQYIANFEVRIGIFLKGLDHYYGSLLGS